MQPASGDVSDRHGFDDNRNYVSEILGRLMPNGLARRAVSVSVATDRSTYAVGDPVEVTATFTNRLPVSIDVPTPKQRLWGWRVDGALEASDERRYTRTQPATFHFRPLERKRVSFEWNGLLEKRNPRHEWVLPEAGEHEIEVFVATADPEPQDTAVIRFEA